MPKPNSALASTGEQPDCRTAETARSRAASIVGTWQDLHVHLYTDAALDDLELRIAHALRDTPSAFASTGDVPYTVAEAVLRAWDKDEADLSHSADMHDAIEALRNVAAPSAVTSTGEQPASTPAVVNYTERARKVIALVENCAGDTALLVGAVAAEFSAVASEHQAEGIEYWRLAQIVAERDEARAKLARLQEPDVREDAAEAGIEAAAEAVSALPMGQRAWNTKEYKIAETSARAAIAWIVEVLSDFFVVGFMVGLGIGWLLWIHGVSISSIRALF